MIHRNRFWIAYGLLVAIALVGGFGFGYLVAPARTTRSVPLPPISKASSFAEIKLHLSEDVQDRGPAETILPRNIPPGSGCVVWRSFELPWRLAYCEIPQGGGASFQPQQPR